MAARLTPSKGSKPDKIMRDALVLALHREAIDADGSPTKKLNVIAAKLVDKAAEGDVPAIREIFDRVEGKAIQMIAGDPDGAPIQTAVTVEFVGKKAG